MRRKKRKGSGRFVSIPHVILDSAAWKSLSSDACRLYVELKRRHNGQNNGFITLSYREAAQVINGGKSTAYARMQELQEHGFVRMVNKGQFQNRHATTWLLTTESDDRANHHPTNDWKNYASTESEKKNASSGTGTDSTSTRTVSHHA